MSLDWIWAMEAATLSAASHRQGDVLPWTPGAPLTGVGQWYSFNSAAYDNAFGQSGRLLPENPVFHEFTFELNLDWANYGYIQAGYDVLIDNLPLSDIWRIMAYSGRPWDDVRPNWCPLLAVQTATDPDFSDAHSKYGPTFTFPLTKLPRSFAGVPGVYSNSLVPPLSSSSKINPDHVDPTRLCLAIGQLWPGAEGQSSGYKPGSGFTGPLYVRVTAITGTWYRINSDGSLGAAIVPNMSERQATIYEGTLLGTTPTRWQAKAGTGGAAGGGGVAGELSAGRPQHGRIRAKGVRNVGQEHAGVVTEPPSGTP